MYSFLLVDAMEVKRIFACAWGPSQQPDRKTHFRNCDDYKEGNNEQVERGEIDKHQLDDALDQVAERPDKQPPAKQMWHKIRSQDDPANGQQMCPKKKSCQTKMPSA